MPDLAPPPAQAAPAAPAAAPVAAPAAAPSPAPQAAPAASPLIRETAGSEAFGDLEALGVDDGAPEPAAANPAPKPRDESGKFVPKPAEVKPATPAPEVKPPAADPNAPVEKMAPKALREAYFALKEKHEKLEKEHTTLKTRAPQDDTEKKELAERLTARERRLQEVENELRFTDYTKSTEYKEQFDKPFEDAYLNGRAKIASLKIPEQVDSLGDIVAPARQATAQDFDDIMAIRDDGDAADAAVAKFGNRASVVLFHREKVQELNAVRLKAIADFKTQGGEREKARALARSTEEKQFSDHIERAHTEAIEKYPQWFKPDPTDAKGNELLEKGQHFVARVAANGRPLKEGEAPMTPEQFARSIAAIRHKAGGFDRMVYRHQQAMQRVNALEKELAGYRGSEPGLGDGKGAKVHSTDDSMNGALADLDSRATEG